MFYSTVSNNLHGEYNTKFVVLLVLCIGNLQRISCQIFIRFKCM